MVFLMRSNVLALSAVLFETSLLPEGLPQWVVVLVAVVLALLFLMLCFRSPAIGRFFGKIAAVVFMGLGVAGLVWGIIASARGDQPLTEGLLAGVSYSLIIGGGAGFLTAGVVALVLACLVRVPAPLSDSPPVRSV